MLTNYLFNPSSYFRFLTGLKRLGTGAMELHAMHLKSIGALCARTLSYEGCEFELVDGISDEKVQRLYNKATEIWTDVSLFDAFCDVAYTIHFLLTYTHVFYDSFIPSWQTDVSS